MTWPNLFAKRQDLSSGVFLNCMKVTLCATSIVITFLINGCVSISQGKYCSYNDKSISQNCIEILDNGHFTQSFKSEGTFKMTSTGTWKRNSFKIQLLQDSLYRRFPVDTIPNIVLMPMFLQKNKIIGKINFRGRTFKQVFIMSK